jgi:hypothetical protein
MKINHIVDEDITRRGFLQGAGAAAVAGAAGTLGYDQYSRRGLWLKDLDRQDQDTIYMLLMLYLTSRNMQKPLPKVEPGEPPAPGFYHPDAVKVQNQVRLIIQNFIKENPGLEDFIEQGVKSRIPLTDDLKYFWKNKDFIISEFNQWYADKKANPLKKEFNKESVNQGVAEAARPPIAPDPQNYDSDWDYYNDRDADDMTDSDPADDMTDDESDDWFDESKEKVGNMDADAFDAALSRMKKLAGAGPLRTVYDPARRVYKNVPHAVQPAQQPKKAR